MEQMAPVLSPEDVGVGEAIHQLDFVQHVLPVRREQVHFEHHHLVGHPVSHLRIRQSISWITSGQQSRKASHSIQRTLDCH